MIEAVIRATGRATIEDLTHQHAHTGPIQRAS
jgi:hypothetical protein